MSLVIWFAVLWPIYAKAAQGWIDAKAELQPEN